MGCQLRLDRSKRLMGVGGAAKYGRGDGAEGERIAAAIDLKPLLVAEGDAAFAQQMPLFKDVMRLAGDGHAAVDDGDARASDPLDRSEEHTSELQSRRD